MEGIGMVIKGIRENAGIDQKSLCRGICSTSTISRFEWDERTISKWDIDAFLERLGKSSDKFWTIIHVKDYNIMEYSRRIWDAILCGDYGEAREVMKLYEKKMDKQEVLLRQFLGTCEGILAGWEEHNWDKSCELLEKAVKMTALELTERNVEKYLLGRTEMLILLLLAESYEKTGKTRKATRLVAGVLENIEGKQWDTEELVKIYPKAVRAWIICLKREDRYEEVIEIARKAVGLLLENGVIYLLEELMECVVWGMKRRIAVEGRGFSHQEEQEYRRWRRYAKVLREIWETYGTIPAEKMRYCTNMQQDISLSSEILRNCRKMCHMTQEMLSANICTSQNLSKIERGWISPMERNYRCMMERMNQTAERTRSPVSVQNYEIQEKLRLIAKYSSSMEYYKAALIWRKLRKQIPKNSLENRQCLARYDTLLRYQDCKDSWKIATQRYERALRITMPDFGRVDISKWPLTRSETILLCNIASGYQETGRTKEAMKIYQDLYSAFEKSKVDVRYRIREYKLVLYNLGIMYTLNGETDQAMEKLERGLYKTMEVGGVMLVPRFLFAMAWTIMNSGEGKEEQKARRLLRQAYNLSELLGLPNLCNEIAKDYQEYWHEKIKI